MLALLCFLTGLVTLLVAGVLLGFSDFIMQALIRSKPAAAIEVMQKSVNWSSAGMVACLCSANKDSLY